MAFAPDKITKQHILDAVKKIESENISLEPSTRFDVIINGKPYPPKEVMRYAHELMNGEHVWERSGGEPTNKYLTALGFKVEEKGSSAINILDLNGKAIYKMSHGIFIKNTSFRNKNSAQHFKEKNWIVINVYTGKGQGEFFKDSLQIGDFVYICYGSNGLSSIGRIASECFELPEEEQQYVDGSDEWVYREIEPLFEPENTSLSELVDDRRFWLPSGNSTLYQIPNSELDYFNEVIATPKYNVRLVSGTPTADSQTKSSNQKIMNNLLNQILFGPPGTGKTFSTVSKAISIANPTFDLSQDREKVKAEFERLISEGQILFTTFHQSMSYEDFIEGIKPETIDKAVTYEIQNGIFKILSNRSLFAYHDFNPTQNLKGFSSFDELYDLYLEDLGTRLSTATKPFYLPLRTKNYFVEIISIDETTIETKGANAENKAYVDKEKVRLLYNRFKTIEDIINVSEDIRSVGKGLGWTSNYYGVFKDLKSFEHNLKPTIANPQKVDSPKKLNDKQIESFLSSLANKYDISFKNAKVKNYVLIIDEINRGNVSQIFGELITLIEEDKRLGKDECLTATLPYSKDKFGVPPNLFIIGTMNTADRSVEALDAALRRRFSFEEMPPIPKLITDKGKLKDSAGKVEGIDLAELLTTINKRIEKLLDKDHLIGHSYFMSVASLESLQEAFQNKINPLLQEYFFGDFGKIGLVLGEGFFQDKGTQSDENLFASFDDYESNDLAERPVYKMLNASEMTAQNFVAAIKQLMKK